MSSMAQIDPVIAKKIDDIDLSFVRQRLMDPKLGKGWSAEKTDNEIRRYRNFLKLISTGGRHTPTLSVDEVWHQHILCTSQYFRDCEHCFGHYIHHDPTIPKNGKGGSVDLFGQTKEVYERLFGEKY